MGDLAMVNGKWYSVQFHSYSFAMFAMLTIRREMPRLVWWYRMPFTVLKMPSSQLVKSWSSIRSRNHASRTHEWMMQNAEKCSINIQRQFPTSWCRSKCDHPTPKYDPNANQCCYHVRDSRPYV